MKLFLLLLVTLAFGRSNVLNKLMDLIEEELAAGKCVNPNRSCEMSDTCCALNGDNYECTEGKLNFMTGKRSNRCLYKAPAATAWCRCASGWCQGAACAESETSNDGCVDLHGSCYKNIASCEKDGWKEYMAENCEKTCGKCAPMEVEVAEMSAQGTAAQCFDPVTDYITERYRLGETKSVSKANYKAKLDELDVKSCGDFYKSTCGQTLRSCLKRKACSKRDRKSYECLEWGVATTKEFCTKDGCVDSEEELAFNKGSKASNCVSGCLDSQYDGWRATACLQKFLTKDHWECEGDEVDQSVSCATKCAAAWPLESTAVGTCSQLASLTGMWKDFYERSCGKKEKNACIAHQKCTWQ